MPQPPAYARQADFTDWSSEHPDTPQQGVSMDAEFNAIVVTLAAVLSNLALVQRDDGALRNASVGIETVSAGLLALINASTGMHASAWLTATTYTAGTSWVSHSTGTYICATSHTSGTFATDLAAGKWVLIFDSGGTTPADGSVTSSKVAAGAVLAAAIGFTALDLAGTIRAGGGLSAGTAALGELLAAKKAGGSVIGKVDRTTRAQGIVGWKIGGGAGGIDWYLRQAADDDALSLYDGTAVRVSWTGPLMDVVGQVRATGDATPAAGAGIGLRWVTAIGYVDAYDFDASAWRPAYYRSSIHRVYCGGVLIADGSSTGMNFPLGATLGGSANAVGYLGVPQNAQSAAYVLTLADRGKHIYSENVAGQTITIPPNSDVAFEIESIVVIVNRGTNPITVAQGAGVTLRWAGTASTGNRTLGVNGLASLLKIGTDVWMLSGAGVS